MRPPLRFVFFGLSVTTHLYTQFCDDNLFLQEHFAFITLDAVPAGRHASRELV